MSLPQDPKNLHEMLERALVMELEALERDQLTGIINEDEATSSHGSSWRKAASG